MSLSFFQRAEREFKSRTEFLLTLYVVSANGLA